LTWSAIKQTGHNIVRDYLEGADNESVAGSIQAG